MLSVTAQHDLAVYFKFSITRLYVRISKLPEAKLFLTSTLIVIMLTVSQLFFLLQIIINDPSMTSRRQF